VRGEERERVNFEEVVKRRTCCVALMGRGEMRRRGIRLFIGVVLSMEGSRLTLDDTWYLCPIYLFVHQQQQQQQHNRFELIFHTYHPSRAKTKRLTYLSI
jgi:hypothetical protein